MKKILGLVFGLIFVGTAPAVALDPCQNLFDASSATNALISSQTGELIQAENYYASDYIPVTANTAYVLSPAILASSLYGLAWYDANKTYISGAVYNQTNSQRFVAPANAVFYGNANTASGATDFTADPIVNNDAEIVGNLWDVEWNASPANNFSGGTLHGVALCSSQSSPTTSPDLSGTNIASNCWCRVKSIETNGQNVPVTRPWVLFSNEAMMGCSNRCSLLCSNWLKQNISNVRPGFLAP